MYRAVDVIFMGTAPFAVPALLALIQNHNVRAIFTQMPKAQGRGMKVKLSAVHEVAIKHNIPVHTPITLRGEQAFELISGIDADVIVVCAYGFIIPANILVQKKYGCLNIHPSSLPKYRGAAPLQHTILNGDSQTDVCIMQMDEGLDTGAIILRQAIDLASDITLLELHDKCAQIGAELLLKTLDGISTLPRILQVNIGSSYAGKLTKQDAKILWSCSAREIDCKIRAMTPWPGSFFTYQGMDIKILKASRVILEHGNVCGVALNDQLLIACGENALQIQVLQKAGGKALDAKEFLRGFPILQGSMLE